MLKVKILVVSSPALGQIVEDLLRGRPEFEVVRSPGGLRGLSQKTGRLLPQLIVADVKPVGTGVRRVVETIKRSSPLSRLILVCPVRDLIRTARKCGADACLEQERLVAHLEPTVRALAAR